MRIEYETKGLIRFQEMRIHFGMILSILMRRRINENMVWTDSQDYGADEILSHPFILTPPAQRAACALPFEGPHKNQQKSFN